MNEKTKIRVLSAEPGKVSYVKAIDRGLAALQQEVGGYVRVIYALDCDAAFLCRAEAELHSLPLNRTLCTKTGAICDVIVGPILVAGLGGKVFVSLSDDLIEKYAAYFRRPEEFVYVRGTVYAVV